MNNLKKKDKKKFQEKQFDHEQLIFFFKTLPLKKKQKTRKKLPT